MRSLGLLALALLSGAASAQDTAWSAVPDGTAGTDIALLIDHEQLRGYEPAGPVVSKERFGPLVLEVRSATAAPSADEQGLVIASPASIVVRLRNRLIAAALGYRLGGDIIHNGVIIEAWDGRDRCQYTQWRLRFAGERLELEEERLLQRQDCDS